MVASPFNPTELVGRQDESQQICQILDADGDLLVAGVPGSGRRTLVRWAAHHIGAKVIEIDCLRSTDAKRLLQLLGEGIIAAFHTPKELALIQSWSNQHPVILEHPSEGRSRLVWHLNRGEEWALLEILLALPQQLAEWLDCRVVVMFQNFPHIRSWDRSSKWEHYLCHEIQRQSRVSYVLIATTAEMAEKNNLQVVTLPPLTDQDIHTWIVSVMATAGFKFSADALELFLSYVRGHLGDAISLARRIWLECRAFEKVKGESEPSPTTLSSTVLSPTTPSQPSPERLFTLKPQPSVSPPFLIEFHHVHRSALALVEDLALTFESLILLLPPSQVRVLESLALDPTDSPHSREYIQKHQLSRGGGLQGALASLEQKGLVYGPEYGYQITLPLLAFWLRHRLS